ncbi:MAG: Gfo/Idh/MocA family oxidoreductase [Phycisphaerae bacterium]|nr:Gfo/Idh/MocA family oxidoreductase [Phycisphaerae bacterium]
MREISVGIIGYGFMGRAHTFGYVTLPLYYEPAPVKVRKLVMCTTSDRNAAAAEATGYYHAVIRDWQQLIADPSIDVVHICTPNSLHHDMLAAAICAGKCIFCDKPVTATWDQARRLRELIEQTNYVRTNQMHMNARFFPATMRAKQLADEGRLGDVLSFRFRQLHATNVDPQKPVNWKSDKTIGGGGVILDLGSHVIDLATHLLGPIRRILCRTDNFTPVRPDGRGGLRKVEAEELAIMIVELENGAVGTLEVSKVATGTNSELQFEIHGRRGAMRFDMMRPNWLGFYDNTDPETPQGGTRGFKDIDCVQHYPSPGGKFPPAKVAGGWLRPHVQSLHNFLAAVADDRQAEPSLLRGIEIQRYLDLAYRSAESQTWQNA